MTTKLTAKQTLQHFTRSQLINEVIRLRELIERNKHCTKCERQLPHIHFL